jgi:hypothetical protein
MKSMFPEIVKEESELKSLVGLKIVKVKSDLRDVIKELECDDEAGELHTIEFKYGVIVVDGDITLVTSTGMY